MKPATTLLAVAGVALVLAACSQPTAGEPVPTSATAGAGQSDEPAPTSPSPGDAGLPHSGAPAVENPLPESVVSGHPCEALTRAQVVEALGEDAPEGKRDDVSIDPGCSWQDSVSATGFSIFFSTETGQGLSAVYANTQPQARMWRELAAIHGFPAVAYQTHGDELCSTVVGLSNEYDVSVTFSQGRNKSTDPCEASEWLAEAVVGNLMQKAGR